jgi:hypothetical protein
LPIFSTGRKICSNTFVEVEFSEISLITSKTFPLRVFADTARRGQDGVRGVAWRLGDTILFASVFAAGTLPLDERARIDKPSM